MPASAIALGPTTRTRLRWLPALLVPLLLASGPLHAELLRAEWVLWLPLVFAYGLLPLLDGLLGEETSDAAPETAADPLLSALPGAVALFGFIVLVGSAGYAVARVESLSGFLALALATGLVGGLSINAAHELGHRPGRASRRLAFLTLAPWMYAHFPVEHNRGHHRDVATPEDSASARLGESIYRFAWREWTGAWRRAFALERERLRASGRSPFSHANRVLGGLALGLTLWAALALALGPKVLPFLLLAAAFAHFQLTSANYVEHYGLLRRLRADGRREPVGLEHAWNSAAWLSNAVLLNLQRHSDHHVRATRPFAALRHWPEAPRLPAGYFAMFLLAYLPPLWFRVMDRRALEAVGGDPARLNLDPRRGAAALRALAERQGG
jgi:alkane 1-monooxygenase